MPPRHAVAARDPEADDSDLGPGDGRDPQERDGGRGGRGASSGAAASEGASFAEASASALQSGQRALHRAAVLLGLAADDKPDDGSIKSFKDCADCPEMVHIAAGAAEIGAADTDEDATRAERPWHTAQNLARLCALENRGDISVLSSLLERHALDLRGLQPIGGCKRRPGGVAARQS